MSGTIDYESIEVPDDEDPEEYHYTARRAEILQLVREAGHPRMLNQASLARCYGTTRQNINNDLDVLAGYIDEALGDRRAFVSSLVFNRAITGLLEEEEWRAAAQTVKDMNEWIENYRELETLDERLTEIEEQQERAKYR